MKKPWKSGIAFGFGNLIRNAVTFNPARLDVLGQAANSPVLYVNMQQCYDCGALLTNERMAAHGQWHRDLHQNFQNIQSPIMMMSTPLLEIRERIEALEEKPVTKVVKRPKKEAGYVQPHRSGNPQSTIPMEIPLDSTSGDLFVYDAQQNKLKRVQQSQPAPGGWGLSPNKVIATANNPSSSALNIDATERPLFDPTFGGRRRQCEWCGDSYDNINSYTVLKTISGQDKAFDVCKSCYDQHRAEEGGKPYV